MTLSPKLELVVVKKLVLDSDNPRFYHLKHLGNRKKLTDQQLQQEIEKDDSFSGLLDQIRIDGVRDPIWVVVKEGSYVVIEGNMRTVALRNLQVATAPDGVRYDALNAHVFPSDTPKEYLAVQRALLQRGKKPWLAFNSAANIYELKTTFKMREDDIAQKLDMSTGEVTRSIQNFKLYVDFTQKTGVKDPDKFSYFSYAPAAIRERFFRNENDKEVFYNLIVPNAKGITRIRSYQSRGGYKEFAKIAENENLLRKFLKSNSMTVQDAYEELLESDIKLTLPFLKKLPAVAGGLRSLSEDQVKAIKDDSRIMTHLKSIFKNIEKLL